MFVYQPIITADISVGQFALYSANASFIELSADRHCDFAEMGRMLGGWLKSAHNQ